MEPVSLNDLADQLEQAGFEWHTFLNTKTGEFESYHPDFSDDDADPERFESEEYIALPTQYDIHEYRIMEAFALEVRDPRKRDALLYALRGNGAFRRFKDALIDMNIAEAWYDYRNRAFHMIAKEWCEEHDIAYHP